MDEEKMQRTGKQLQSLGCAITMLVIVGGALALVVAFMAC